MSRIKKEVFRQLILDTLKVQYPNAVFLDIHKFLIDSALEEFYIKYLSENQIDTKTLLTIFFGNYVTALNHVSSIIPNDGQPFTITIEDKKFSIPSLEDYAIFDDLGRNITDHPFP
jgi:hypothetical protein